MKKKVTIASIILVSILIGVLVSINFKNEESSFKEKDYSSNTQEQIVGENTLSMMLETAAGSGEYEMTTQSNWPADGYVFNATLSKCENGGELSWDDENKVVSMSGNMSDKCYVYFDKLKAPTLAEYVIKQCGGTQGNNNIYYHNGTITSDDGTVLDANDNSYRYAGASPDNYICFDTTCTEDTLYRIIGVFNNQVKVIKATSIGNMYWDTGGSNTWSTSSLYAYLQGTYLTSISSFSSKIASSTWKVGGVSTNQVTAATMYTNEMTSTNVGTDNNYEISAQIGLMYASDYGFAASPTAWSVTLLYYNGNDSAGTAIKTINWLYLGSSEWLVSRISGYSNRSLCVYSVGYVIPSGVDRGSYAVRPVFYLESSATYSSGDGSSSNPIKLG